MKVGLNTRPFFVLLLHGLAPFRLMMPVSEPFVPHRAANQVEQSVPRVPLVPRRCYFCLAIPPDPWEKGLDEGYQPTNKPLSQGTKEWLGGRKIVARNSLADFCASFIFS